MTLGEELRQDLATADGAAGDGADGADGASEAGAGGAAGAGADGAAEAGADGAADGAADGHGRTRTGTDGGGETADGGAADGAAGQDGAAADDGAELSVDEFLDQLYADVWPQARAPGQAREDKPTAPSAPPAGAQAASEGSQPASWEVVAERYADDPETAAMFREFGKAMQEIPELRRQLEHYRTMAQKVEFIQAARPYEERCRKKFPDWQKVGKRVWALAMEKNLTEDQAYALVKLERGETRLSPPASAERQEAASPPVRAARTVRPSPEHADASEDVTSIRDGVAAAVAEAKRNKIGIFG